MSFNLLETANLPMLRTLRLRRSGERSLAQVSHLVDRIETICDNLTLFSCDPELEHHCLNYVNDLIGYLKKIDDHRNRLTSKQLSLLKQAYSNFQCWRMTTNSHPHLNSERVGAVCTAFDRIIN